jgi:hypothetical protein
MKVYPVDPQRFLAVICFALIFEVSRILIGYIVGREKGIMELTEHRILVMAELSKIKNEQLEFVKKTKLERKKISFEKDIEKIKLDYIEAAPKWKRFFRSLRFVVYGVGILHFSQEPLVMMDKVMFWPIAPLSSYCSIVLSAWTVLPIASFAFRHLLRAIAPLVTSSQFP